VEVFLEDDMPDFATFLEVLGRLYINGFEICTERMETYGWGVYLGPRSDHDQRRQFSSRFFSVYRWGKKWYQSISTYSFSAIPPELNFLHNYVSGIYRQKLA
jgi:hypothetical protein